MTVYYIQRGVGLVELLVVVVILAILATIAVPSFVEINDRYRVKAVADTTSSILHLARSEAVVSNVPVFVSVTSGNNSCIGARRNGTCDCNQVDASAADYCTFKLINTPELKGVQVSAAAFGANSYTVFDPVRGTASSGAIALVSANGRNLSVNLSALGRVKMCSPAGSGRLTEYPVC